jgi:formate hydrogenlyase transcriptional activator
VSRKVGRFELADGGTIFLDEIGELPMELQPKLLRVLQDGEFERLGSADNIRADVRVIAATNRDLSQDVQARRFRADLFYRLNVYPIGVPPLRQRREDIPLLVEHFVRVLSKKIGKEITSVAPSALETLREYLWPGNVRELANVIERAIITSTGTLLQIPNTMEMFPAAAPHSRVRLWKRWSESTSSPCTKPRAGGSKDRKGLPKSWASIPAPCAHA